MDLCYPTDGTSTHGPMFFSVDRRYFFDCVSPSVQMHSAETDVSLAAVFQLHDGDANAARFSPLLHSLTATSLPNTCPLSLKVLDQYSNL